MASPEIAEPSPARNRSKGAGASSERWNSASASFTLVGRDAALRVELGEGGAGRPGPGRAPRGLRPARVHLVPGVERLVDLVLQRGGPAIPELAEAERRVEDRGGVDHALGAARAYGPRPGVRSAPAQVVAGRAGHGPVARRGRLRGRACGRVPPCPRRCRRRRSGRIGSARSAWNGPGAAPPDSGGVGSGAGSGADRPRASASPIPRSPRTPAASRQSGWNSVAMSALKSTCVEPASRRARLWPKSRGATSDAAAAWPDRVRRRRGSARLRRSRSSQGNVEVAGFDAPGALAARRGPCCRDGRSPGAAWPRRLGPQLGGGGHPCGARGGAGRLGRNRRRRPRARRWRAAACRRSGCSARCGSPRRRSRRTRPWP